jgi:radical SAM protein with 4Fe4S-binding SPASM domain
MASVILKATESCNSNCYYCDVVRKQDTGASMPLSILEMVFRRVDEYLAAKPGETVNLLWHGGEPLLLGPDYFHAAGELQQTYCARTSSRIHHSIQTNLTCFHEGFLEVFRKLGITGIGTSYDPEPHVRGPGKEIDTDAYNRKFLDSLALLERNGIGWGMIYVVTRKSLRDPLGVFFHLTNLLLTGGVNLNPVLIYDEGRKDIAVSPEEYVDFLGTIFPHWWKHRDRFPDVNPFKSLVECIIKKNLSLGCVDSGDCAYVHINVAPDGETSQCGRSADWKLLPYGNIADHTLEQILADGQRAQLAERVRMIHDGDCKGCRFWTICHGGCPLDSWSQHKDFLHKSEWCEARRGFIEKYFEPITEVRFEPQTA